MKKLGTYAYPLFFMVSVIFLIENYILRDIVAPSISQSHSKELKDIGNFIKKKRKHDDVSKTTMTRVVDDTTTSIRTTSRETTTTTTTTTTTKTTPIHSKKNPRHDDYNRILSILEHANVNTTNLDPTTLPTWSDIIDLYGPSPIIHGLDTCQTFRDSVPDFFASIAPAGMFNTGTHLLAELLQRNCYMPGQVAMYGVNATGMRWQVPWGKHRPVGVRLHHVANAHPGIETSSGEGVRQETVLPVVIIKDLYSWMRSMCKQGYTAFWPYAPDKCPDLLYLKKKKKLLNHEGKKRKIHVSHRRLEELADDDDDDNDVDESNLGRRKNNDGYHPADSFPIQRLHERARMNHHRMPKERSKVLYKRRGERLHKHPRPRKRKLHKFAQRLYRQDKTVVVYDMVNYTEHSSIIGIWNDWYNDWYNVSFPRLMIRYEDLLFHSQSVLRSICTCGGGRLRGDGEDGDKEDHHHVISESAKKHGGSAGLLEAIRKYGNATLRVKGLSRKELEYAKVTASEKLMEVFKYKLPIYDISAYYMLK